MTTRRRPQIGLALIVVACAVFFIVPFIATIRFGFAKPLGGGYTFKAITRMVHADGFGTALWLSARLAFGTTFFSLLLMVPTLAWLHLKMPKLLPAFEVVSVLPYAIPAVALVSGAATAFRKPWPFILIESIGMIPLYAIVALPFTYRSIDNGLRAIDVKTLSEAARGLGASWPKTLFAVIVPNISTSLLGAAFLNIAIAFGEYTIASLLLHQTFSAFVVRQANENPRGATAMGLLSILFTCLTLGLVSSLSRRRKGGRVTFSAFGR